MMAGQLVGHLKYAMMTDVPMMYTPVTMPATTGICAIGTACKMYRSAPFPSHLAAVPYPASCQPTFGSNATLLLSPLREKHFVATVPFLLPFAVLANMSRGVARLCIVDRHILLFILISTTQHNT